MRLKERWIDFWCKLLYCFKPISVILACLVFMVFIDAVCAVLMFVTANGTVQDILLAILTGVTASVLVAVMVEMANNYQRNDKRWVQLSRLFGALTHYEQDIDIETGHFDARKAHLDLAKELHEKKVKEGMETQEEAVQAIEKITGMLDKSDLKDNLPSGDKVHSIFNKLPKLIPLIEDAYRNHSDDFQRGELESMSIILDNHQKIKDMISMAIMRQSTLSFGNDPKNSGDLVEWLPARLKKDLDESTLLCLAMDVWETERKHIAEVLMRQGELALDGVGIKIGDGLLAGEDNLDNSINDEEENTRCDNTYGKIISCLVEEIDRELLQLRKIINSEPGFKTMFDYVQDYSARYRR